MRSKFDSPLEIVGDVIKARGDLEWAGGETEAVVSVTIIQRGEDIAGTASSPPTFAAEQPKWKLNVQPAGNRKFKKGPARATGVACGMGAGPVSVFHWSEDIVLEKAD